MPRPCPRPRERTRTRAQALALALAFTLALLAPRPARAQNDPAGGFPVKIPLPISAVQGAVAGDGTTVYVTSHAGEIYLADVKSGKGELLNRGGDGQTLADVCLDSRDAKTLYAAGRGSGLLYAFTAAGDLVRRFVLTPADGAAGAPHYISSCVQSRYFLYALDAYADVMYRFDLADEGPTRGQPPPQDDGDSDGTPIALAGDWEPAADGQFGAISIEWSQVWNETGFVLNHDTGKIYVFPLDAPGVAKMSQVDIEGEQSVFPGATKIMFDERNELIMYVAQPGRNAIAVVELVKAKPTRAKYIRTITSPLINGPIGLAQFGDWIFSLNADLGAESRDESNSNLVQLPRHFQKLGKDVDPDEPFTPTSNKDDPPQKEEYDEETVADVMTEDAPASKNKPVKPSDEDRAPKPIEERPAPVETETDSRRPEKPGDDSVSTDADDPIADDLDSDSSGDVFDQNFKDEPDDSGASCFPSHATVRLATGVTARMDQLRVGDLVEVAAGQYSRIFMFTHRDAQQVSDFVRISHKFDNSVPLMVSPGHYIYVNDELATASAVRVGDVVEVLSCESGAVDASCASRKSTVISVARVSSTGLFNPQTEHGDVVVSNVLASTYTSAIDPRLAVALLTPLRHVSRAAGTHWNALMTWIDPFSHGSMLASVLPSGPQKLCSVSTR